MQHQWKGIKKSKAEVKRKSLEESVPDIIQKVEETLNRWLNMKQEVTLESYIKQ